VIGPKRDSVLAYTVLVVFAIFALAPILSLGLIALRPPNSLGVGGVDVTKLHFGNFKLAWDQAGLGSAFKASAVIAVFVSLAGTACAVLGGYALGCFRFFGRNIVRYFFLVGLIAPTEAAVVPLFYGEEKVGLLNHYAGAFLPLTGLGISLGAFWMRAFFVGVPRELLDAAKVDGSTPWKTLIRILIPMARPAILTLAMLLFLTGWNDFLISLVTLQNPNVQTLQLAISEFRGTYLTNDTLIAAAAVMAVAPIIVIFLLTQRRFIRGIVAGSVKG
jgi:raffinose/stachyose/melibiose transport system permease protein